MPQQIYPDFLPAYHCKCAACRRTCCQNDWEIVVSRQEYQADMDPALGLFCHTLAEDGLCQNPFSSGDADYGMCQTREDGLCRLLTEDRLCGWQLQRGKCVGTACDDFPRTYIRYLDSEYLFPTSACEAIVELLLHHEEPIRLLTAAQEQIREYCPVTVREENFATRPLLKWYPELIQWGLTLLQHREYSLDERFLFLSGAMSTIDWVERKGRTDELAKFMEAFLSPDNLNRYAEKYGKMTIGPQALLAVNANAFAYLYASPVHRAYCKQVLDALGAEYEELDLEGRAVCQIRQIDTEKYKERKARLQEYMKQKEIFLEHIMVTEYLRSMAPLMNPSVWDHFRFFNVCYALIKGAIYASFSEPPTDDQLVDVVVRIHRMFIHNFKAYDYILTRLDEIQLTDPLSMIALIRG